MNKLFYNMNGNTYYIWFGEKGKKALLCNVEHEQYVICEMIEEYSWWQGSYFNTFEEAYGAWKGN